MAGGLMTLASVGAENIILNGNPKKTFFKTKYNKYTNFGMQRFRLDYKGLRELKIHEETEMNFVIPRYADLLHDVYVVVNLPNIYSSVYWPSTSTKSPLNNGEGYDNRDYTDEYEFRGSGYDFRWIENLGSHMIKQITITGGGQILAQYSGEFLECLKERDFSETKKKLWNKMTGNIPELNDPARVFGAYPCILYRGNSENNPSIRSRQLMIPIESWFGTSSKTALPLVAIQYNEISIKIVFRPVKELYRIRDVEDLQYNFPYIRPNPGNDLHSLYKFIHPPQDEKSSVYKNKREDWNADVHLLANYVFLDNDERTWFAETEQQYLVQQVFEKDYFNVTGSVSVEIQSRDLVPSYMWRFRRSDAFERNEWSNYSNWAYNDELPSLPSNMSNPVLNDPSHNRFPSPSPNIYIYTQAHNENKKKILTDLALVIDGEYRENSHPACLYEYGEKWLRTKGNARDGIYCYNFCIDSNMREYQPSGAQNMSTFKSIRLEFNTNEPPINPEGKKFDVICSDPTETNPNGVIIGVRKNAFELYDYTYDLRIYEFRYNVISIISGRIGLMYAR